MKIFQEIHSSNLSLPTETFIFSLTPVRAPTAQQNALLLSFAAISSDDSLTFFQVVGTSTSSSPPTASLEIESKIQNAHSGVSVCKPYHAANANPVLFTGGRDGLLRFWDCDTKVVRKTLKTPNGQGISAIACLPEKNLVAAGTELEAQGPGDVAVYIWDLTATDSTTPIRAYTDSHTDTLTCLFFHPSSTSPSSLQTPHLITSSTDGLISLFDPTPPAEDDALLLVFNNKAAIQHVCPFTTSSGTQALCAVSHDEKISVFEVSDAEEAQVEWPVMDVRERLVCDYVIGVEAREKGIVLIVGSYRSETLASSTPPRALPTVDLYTVTPRPPTSVESASASSAEQTTFDHVIRLHGAHGEEVVRDIWFDDNCPFILTCGEDGHVRVWADGQAKGLGIGGDIGEEVGRREKKRKDKEKRKKGKNDGSGSGRFKPY